MYIHSLLTTQYGSGHCHRGDISDGSVQWTPGIEDQCLPPVLRTHQTRCAGMYLISRTRTRQGYAEPKNGIAKLFHPNAGFSYLGYPYLLYPFSFREMHWGIPALAGSCEVTVSTQCLPLYTNSLAGHFTSNGQSMKLGREVYTRLILVILGGTVNDDRQKFHKWCLKPLSGCYA